ncbi:hypothetical protein [Lactobacillus sp. PV037]|nr:hypothetical protein [Lactobacillus sp. PV037]
MGQQLLTEKGVLPTDFYNGSFSDWTEINKAKSRKDREVDPLDLIHSLGE